MESFEECNAKITREVLPDYYVIYERRFGSYEGIRRSWTEFLEKYGAYITEETCLLERTYDDPAVTAPGNCLYDICMSAEIECPLENTALLKGGSCVVYHFKGHAKYIYAAYQTIFWCGFPGHLMNWMRGGVCLIFITWWTVIRCIWSWISVFR